MRVVFIAGPYRALSEWAVTENIRRAEVAAIEVWRAGGVAICPHKNTAYFGGAARDEVWLEGGRELVGRSDAVLCIEGWEQSEGARGEVEKARQCGVPVFRSIEEVAQWVASHRSDH
jgi:hypothetical protein